MFSSLSVQTESTLAAGKEELGIFEHIVKVLLLLLHFFTSTDLVLGVSQDLPRQVMEFSKDAFTCSPVCRHYSKRGHPRIQHKAE
jgi:hypothetical protein